MYTFVMFYINLYISFIYEGILTKFAKNVCGYENISVKNFFLNFQNQNGSHRLFYETLRCATK